jgi:septum formation protein
VGSRLSGLGNKSADTGFKYLEAQCPGQEWETMNSSVIDSPTPGRRAMTLTLVSSSPQRAQLLRDEGYEFEVVSPALDEPSEKSPRLTPAQHAQALAYYKAASVAEKYPNSLLLGADTIVVANGKIFGKPADADDARRILSILTTTPHEVITGVALLAPADVHRVIADEVTRITMRPMEAAQLDAYLASGVWRGKAGGYGLQAGGDEFVESIDGSYSNVIGLPMELLGRLLDQFDV